MKLYDLKQGDKFRVIDDSPKVPVGAPNAEENKVYLFSHLDGMYSYCKDGDKVVHFAAWTEVEMIDYEP